MIPFATISQWFLGLILILSSIGVITFKKPVHASLSFLLTLLALAALYLQLSAEFIAVMQILVYAGAILVIFMFVIILFQDAHGKILTTPAKSPAALSFFAAISLSLVLTFLAGHLFPLTAPLKLSHSDYGTAQSLGRLLYLDYAFPFEAIILLFLVALVGSLYVAKKER